MKVFFALFLLCSLYSFADTRDCIQSVSSATDSRPDTENIPVSQRISHVKEIVLYHLEKGRIVYTNRARKRMNERLISEEDVERTLREGVHSADNDFFNDEHNDWHYYIADIEQFPLPEKVLKVALSLQYIQTNAPKIVVISIVMRGPPTRPRRKSRSAPKIRGKQEHRQKNFRKKITHYDEEDFDANDY